MCVELQAQKVLLYTANLADVFLYIRKNITYCIVISGINIMTNSAEKRHAYIVIHVHVKVM
jgi:hypothetical protein